VTYKTYADPRAIIIMDGTVSLLQEAADMSRWIRALLPALPALLLLATPAAAVIKNLIPLRTVVSGEQMIFEAKVEKLDPSRPAAFFVPSEALKGKVPFKRLAVNMAGDAEAQREKHTEQMLKRLAPDLNVLMFVSKKGPRYLAFVYTNGTWFQMEGRGESDDELKWSFLHGEPYLRRTFKGTTAELRSAIADGLAGKPVPGPDEKAEPGYGPEVKPPSNTGGGGPPLGVAPTFLLIGPLALLAMLFPGVFGGLAVFMKRWTVALSVCCTASTIYFAHAWFYGRLEGTWFGPASRVWALMGILSVIGGVWAARRYRNAIANGDLETYVPRKWDGIVLAVLTIISLSGIGIALVLNKPLLQPPWLDLIAFSVPAWAALAVTRKDHPGNLSTETVFLWAFAFACFNVAALETGRGESRGGAFQELAATGTRGPKPVGKLWEQRPTSDGTTYPTPLAAGDRVYVGAVQASGLSQNGMVFALDANTGAILWMFDNEQAMKPVFCSPELADGRLYIGEGFHEDKDCKMFCLNARDGKKLWEFPTQSHTESTPTVIDGKVYFGAGDDGVYCVDAISGKKVWNYAGVHVDTKPIVADSKLYVGSGVGDIHQTTVLLCLDAKTGNEVWKVPTELPAFAPPALAGSQVYFGIGNGDMEKSHTQPRGGVLCVEAATGKRVWYAEARDAVLAQPAVDSDSVYFTSRDEHVYCVSRAEGRPRWKRPLGGPVVAAPTLVGDDGEFGTVRSLYVASTSGRVECLNVDTGEPFWSLDLTKISRLPRAKVSAAPTVVVRRDGGTERRRVYIAAMLMNDLSTLARWYCFEDEVK
jgi:outer membrane protein assembly factor BamB